MQASPSCNTPGRREARREERREAILEVAGRSFLENGYAGTSMSAIAGTLGGSKGTLWSYFPSKEQLFSAVLERATTEFRSELRIKLSEADSLETAIGRFCETFIAKLNSPEGIALQRLVVGESGRFPEVGRIYYEHGPLPTLELLSDMIGRGMERGLLVRADSLHAAQYLMGLCTARSALLLLTGVRGALSAAETRDQARAATLVFLRAYRPDPAE